jgi:hypothetical protein
MTHLTISHMRFQLSDVVLWSWHHHLHIWELFSVIRCLAVAALTWMLDLWSSRQAVYMETGSLRWIFSSAVTCAAVVLCFFETLLLSVWWSLSVNVDFHLLFLFADVVFPWFTYADITLETVTLSTPNNMAVSSQMFQLNTHQWSVLLQNQKSLPFSDSFTQTVTQQSLMHCHEHYRV